jgi:hypothetical protein
MQHAAPPPDEQPAISLRKPSAETPGADRGSAWEVGDFRQGSELSQWALARYLVGRAIGESVGRALLVVAAVLVALGALIWWAGSRFWAVVLVVVACGVLALRGLLRAVLRRLTAAGAYAPLEQRLRALVADTRGDVLRELRRVGVPGHTWTLPLLGFRLARRRSRARTLERLRGFDVDRAVPAARLDELHLLLRSAVGRDGGGVRRG